MIEITVVVPVYGCGACLDDLYRRLSATLASLSTSFELVFVDDRSPDGAWERLRAIARSDPRVRAYRLSRNFGQAAAITAGLTVSRGRWTVVMDCDLEEPPEEIPRLYAKALEGYDVVRGVRHNWHHPWLRRAASRAYRLLVMESGHRAEYGTLSILSRKVVDAYLALQDTAREYVLLLDWLGFEQSAIEFEHQERPAGGSSFTVGNLIRTGLDGVFFRTSAPLRLVMRLGVLIAVAGAGLASYEVYSQITGHNPPGYTTLVVLLLVLGGFVIVAVGVVGVYVGRIFDQVRQRPLYVVDEIVSEETASDPVRSLQS
jgi:polyisoprenyl-phosphate glycosyltransferase